MNRRGRRALAGFVLAAGLAVGGGGSAAAEPGVEVGDTTIGIGQQVSVTGSGWPPGTLVTLEVCGNGAIDGSVDCHQPSAREVGVRRDGTFGTVFRVQRPQGMCPCVLRVSNVSATDVVGVPVTILGVPLGEAKSRYTFPAIARVLNVRRSELQDAGPWTAWVGAAPTPTLVLEVVNKGDVLLRDPPLTLTWGKGSKATAIVPLAAKIGNLEPGESRTLRIPVRLESLAFGSYRVEGEIHGLGEPVTFRAKTSSYPWGLIAAGLVALQLVLLKVRNRLRRHLVPTEESRGVLVDQEARELALVAQVPHLIPRRPARTPREAIRPALVAVGRPVERMVGARRRRNSNGSTAAGPGLRTRPLMVGAREARGGNGNGSHRVRTPKPNGHRTSPRHTR